MAGQAGAVRSLAVIGSGTMGAGIAQTAILAGIHTTIREIDQPLLDRGLATIRKNLDRLAERGKLDAPARDAALACLHGATDLAALASVDAVIEAVPEILDLKKKVFADLEQVCTNAVFLASNTSSLPVQEIATAVKAKERVLGLHYFNPAQVLPLVDVVTPLTVAEETVQAALAFCRATGKSPIRVKDTPAFVVNRLFVPFAMNAMRLWESGVASAEDIDQGCKLGVGHSMGPLATSDLVGLDVMLHVAESMFAELRAPAVAPPTILRRLVSAGHLGRKTGRGIFDYSS